MKMAIRDDILAPYIHLVNVHTLFGFMYIAYDDISHIRFFRHSALWT